MKKIYSLLFSVALAFTAQAQNHLTNPSFENWTSGTPDGWTLSLTQNGGGFFQETSVIQHLSSSLKLQAGTSGNHQIYQIFPVTPGETYTFSYWYFDNDDNVRLRHWGAFRNGTTALPSNEQVASFQNEGDPANYENGYLKNTPTGLWVQVTVTGVAPAGCDNLRMDFRVYTQSGTANSGIAYVDNASFTGNLSSRDNNIAGLNIYPNPVSDNLYVSTALNGKKSVAIYDVLGKQVINTTVENSPINVTGLKSGVYIVKVTEEGKTATRKFVVK